MDDATYAIEVVRAAPGDAASATLDGVDIAANQGGTEWTIAPGAHGVRLVLPGARIA
jgi:hypothetical protein